MMTDWPDDETVLTRFREWLDEARAEADELAADGEPLEGTPEFRAVGLMQLIEEFTALRHELKLQTKTGRKLEEQTAATLEAMQRAIDEFRSVKARESEAAQGAAKPLVEAIIDLHEALGRGQAAIESARRRILEESPAVLHNQLEQRFRSQPWWRRWISRPFYDAAREICRQQADEAHRTVFDSLIEGYRLIQSRLKKAMDQEGIYPIQCVGQPVDPQTMTVLEVVEDPARPPGLVIEEVRTGYYWKANVFRYAEVRAVQGHSSSESQHS